MVTTSLGTDAHYFVVYRRQFILLIFVNVQVLSELDVSSECCIDWYWYCRCTHISMCGWYNYPMVESGREKMRKLVSSRLSTPPQSYDASASFSEPLDHFIRTLINLDTVVIDLLHAFGIASGNQSWVVDHGELCLTYFLFISDLH